MAVALATTFADLTEIRDAFDEISGKFSGLATAKNAVVTRFDTAGFEDIIGLSEDVFTDLYDALDAALTAYANVMKQRFIHRLMREDFAGIRIVSGLTDDQILEMLLVEFWRLMVTDADRVRSNTVSLGAVTASKTKTNAGTIDRTTRLPGNTAPTVDGFANLFYFDELSELSKSDTAFIQCVSDVQSNQGLERGYESFVVSGFPAATAPFSARNTKDGDGSIRYLTPLQGRSVFHLGFDVYTVADTPDGWTIDGGAAGTEINEEATASKVVGGTGSAVSITGTSSMYRPILPSEVVGRSQMCLALLLRKDGASAGTYTISVTGTGFSTVTSGALNASALTTTYVPQFFRIPVPANIPSDFRINIDSSAISGGTILIDQGGFAEYEYWNGVGIAISEGEDSFTVGDNYYFTVSNDFLGDAQSTFAKVFRAQQRSIDVGYDYA